MKREQQQTPVFRIGEVTNCMDVLAEVREIETKSELKECFLQAIETLRSYPKPQKKGDKGETTPETLGAYLCVSNARNALKLATIGVLEYLHGYSVAQINLELALSLLLVE